MTTERLPNALEMSDADYARERNKPDLANYNRGPAAEPLAEDAPLANALVALPPESDPKMQTPIPLADSDPRFAGFVPFGNGGPTSPKIM